MPSALFPSGKIRAIFRGALRPFLASSGMRLWQCRTNTPFEALWCRFLALRLDPSYKTGDVETKRTGLAA
jgi:hypothetical protein